MSKYRYEGKFKCSNCSEIFTKKGTCRPKACPSCNADKLELKLINKKEL